jgi:thiol-disulfide isomerase/thioredoxin
MRFPIALAIGALTVAGCADPALEARVADLEAKVAAQQTTIEGLKAGGGNAGAPVDQEAEKAAATLVREASQAMRDLDYDLAKAKLAELKEKYPSTRASRSAAQLEGQLAIIGADAGDLSVEKWYTGKTSFDEGEATLVVFFEEWCPHCKREVPKLEATYKQYNSKGLNVVGLTRITKSATEEKVKDFISSNTITYPVAKEDGSMADKFAVQGIPAAAVVKDGKIVWRGHPAQITDAMLNGWIQG